jgi:hypothetical protein
MRKKLNAYLDAYVRQNWLRATPESLFASAAAVFATTVCYALYLQLFLVVQDSFPEPSPFEFLIEQWSVRLRLAFELVALGVLWRYLTPKRLYRFWQLRLYEVDSPSMPIWKNVVANLALIVCVCSLGLAALLGIGGAAAISSNYKTPPTSHDRVRITESQAMATPCYQDKVLPLTEADQATTDTTKD